MVSPWYQLWNLVDAYLCTYSNTRYQFTMPNAKKKPLKTWSNVFQKRPPSSSARCWYFLEEQKKCPSSSLSSKCHDLNIYRVSHFDPQVQLDTLLLRWETIVISFEFCNREQEKLQVSPPCAKCANFFFLSCFICIVYDLHHKHPTLVQKESNT